MMKGLRTDSFLITPVQRITKYKLLIEVCVCMCVRACAHTLVCTCIRVLYVYVCVLHVLAL